MSAGRLWLLAFFSPLALSAQSYCDSAPVRIGVFESGVEYYIGRDGAEHGINKDLSDLLARRTGCRIERVRMSRARIWVELQDGHLDMTVSALPGTERDRLAWNLPYFTARNLAVMLAGTGRDLREARDFIARPPLRFGVVRSFRYGAGLDDIVATLRTQQRIVEYADPESLFVALADGQVAAAFAREPNLHKLLEDHLPGTPVVLRDWAPGQPSPVFGLVLSRQRFSMRQAAHWQALLQTLRADGTLFGLYRQHVGEETARKMLMF